MAFGGVGVGAQRRIRAPGLASTHVVTVMAATKSLSTPAVCRSSFGLFEMVTLSSGNVTLSESLEGEVGGNCELELPQE